jgi:hypothetical protein
MKFTRLANITTHGLAASLTLLAVVLTTGTIGAGAEEDDSRPLHIVKDCATFNPIPGSAYCTIITSDVAELPPGTRVYYDQITAGPTAGVAGFLDSNVFIYINENHWAVGRCTVPNDSLPGLCTISDGVGPLAAFSARINVTYKPGGDGALYAWDGTYRFSRHSD